LTPLMSPEDMTCTLIDGVIFTPFMSFLYECKAILISSLHGIYV